MHSVKLEDTIYIYIYIYKSLLFLYSNNEVSEREVKEAIPFIIWHHIKNHKINLSKEVEHQCFKSYKTLMWEVVDGHTQLGSYYMFLDWNNQYC